jgi:hypothetical protein
MKFILIATVFGTMQPVYDNQETCNMAAKVINESYPLEQALCIPMPETTYKSTQQDRLFTNFVEMIKEIQKLEQSTVDKAND